MSLHASSDVQPRRADGRFVSPQEDRTLSHGVPAEPLLKVLPIKRWIPQDIHSVMDYVDGLTVANGYFMPENKRDDAACWASLALGASVIGVSLLTDYRLSAAKLIPIRVHETADYLWGASAIALPFLLGYWKTSPRVAMSHVIVGAGALLASLFTDYRSYKQERSQRRSRQRSQADLDAVQPT